jgi:hypothetical protein
VELIYLDFPHPLSIGDRKCLNKKSLSPQKHENWKSLRWTDGLMKENVKLKRAIWHLEKRVSRVNVSYKRDKLHRFIYNSLCADY